MSGEATDMCHNGHPFEPGIDVDMAREGRSPDGRWCNVCGESRRPYNREVLVNTIIYHGRTSIKGCHCGWSVLGASHAEHVADVYEESVASRKGVV